MSNNIELITKYSPKAWDTVYKQESMSSLLDADSKLVQFTGAKTVKIAKWQNGGLHNYYRNNFGDDRVENRAGNSGSTAGSNLAYDASFIGAPGFGYQKSGARLVWEEFTLRVDRAAAFLIEKFDNEESGEELVGLGVTEISRTTIVPEVDAYCFSTLAGYCDAQLGNYVAESISSTPLAMLNAAFLYFDNHEVPIQDQIIFVSPKFLNALRQTSEVTKFLGQTDFNNKDIKFTITEYEGRKLVTVSPERLRTNIVLGAEGYSWASDSKPINFLAVSKSAVAHVVKYEKVKVIGDDLNLAGNGFDGYTIYARIYHDVFVPDNKKICLYVSVTTDSTAAAAMTVADAISVQYTGTYSEAATVTDITYFPGNKLVSYGYAINPASAITVGGNAPATIYGMKVGTVIDMSQPAATAAADKTVYLYAYAGGKVTAVQTITVPKLSA